jgi:hypothetical protein
MDRSVHVHLTPHKGFIIVFAGEKNYDPDYCGYLAQCKEKPWGLRKHAAVALTHNSRSFGRSYLTLI